MKYIYTILSLCFVGNIAAQTTVQGRIEATSSETNCVTIYAMPSADISDPPSNFLFSLSIPDQGATNPDAGITVELAGMQLDDFNPAPAVNGARYQMDFNLVQAVASPAPLNWTGGEEYIIAEVCFDNGTEGEQELVQINDLQATGGPSFFSYWYAEVQGEGDVTDYNTPFYDDAGVTSTADISSGGDSNSETTDLVSLPVILKSFTAEKHTESSTMVRWTSSSEINASHYEVERSTDQVTWSFVGKVSAAGNSSVEQSYELVDRDINLNSRDDKKIYYYRLKMVDLDGAYEYSPVDAVSFDAIKVSGMFVYPNPTVQDVFVTLEHADNAVLRVVDRNGKVVLTQKVVTGQDERVVLSNLPSGVYMLSLIQNDEVQTQQVIKMD